MTGVPILLVFSILIQSSVSVFDNLIDLEVVTTNTFVFWPNATIPFYVNQEHFDREQTLSIMTTLSLFEFKSCLKFSPVLVSPEGAQHVLVFHNPAGQKHCSPARRAHALNEPHYVPLGYDCLQSPQLEQAVMIALGFPFEHNRMIRDVYVDVQPENVAAGAEEFFTKDTSLPVELRNLPYDFDSVMHFGEREFSKNGHRTIIFKNPYTKQQRLGLSPLDVRKIEIVYGAECRARDRQAKVELCQGYPGVARRKRAADDSPDYTRSLRVNPDITPPPEVVNNASNSNDGGSATDLNEHLKQLGVHHEVQDIVDRINKVTATALAKARVTYCNDTKTILRSEDTHDLLNVVKSIATYTQGILDRASDNRTEFCQASESVAMYHRAGCGYGNNNDNERCLWNQQYKSTRFGQLAHSTQHRPWIKQSTQHYGLGGRPNKYESAYIYRASLDNSTEDKNVTEKVRRKREAQTPGGDDVKNESVVKKIGVRRYGASGYRSDDDFKKTDISKYLSDEEPRKRKRNRYESEERAKKQSRERINDYDNDRSPIRPNYNKNKKYWSDDNKPQKKSYEDNDYDYDHPRNVKNKPKVFHYESQERQQQNGRDKNRDSRERVRQFAKEKSMERNSDEPRRPAKKQRYSYEDTNENTNKKYQSQETRKPKYNQNSSPEEQQKYSNEEKIEPKLSKKKATEASAWKKKTEKDLPRVVTLTKANLEFYNDRKWPDGIVRYFITDQPQFDRDDLRARLEEVNHILKKKTCVRLQEVTPQDGHRDYLILDTSPDYVTGRVGGKQIFGSVELFQGGQHRQHAAMMVMAWLGFYFEVAREDRDKYVRVHMRHIRPDKLHHFEMIREDATLPLPYDFASATHPAWQFWRRVGKTGISSVATYKDQDPDGSVMKSLGQNEQLLSNIDIIKINSVYGTQCLRSGRKSDPGPADAGETEKTKMLEPIISDSESVKLKKKRKVLEPAFL